MQRSNSRILEFQSRGTAIFLVLVFHYISQQGPAAAGSLTAYVQRATVMWWTGVDLFFVLSGFLIGGILMDARESPSFFRTFYIRRFFRIIPIYYLSDYLVCRAGGGGGDVSEGPRPFRNDA